MRAFVVFLVCASLTFWRGNCYVDNCRSLNVDRLRTQTKNLTLNYSTEEAIDDKFRFSRSVEEDGFVQYVSPFGFESVTIFGYAYSPDTGDTDWQLELRVAPSPFAKVTTVYVLNRTNLSQHEQALIPSNDVPTNWRKFKFSYDLQCPKVVLSSKEKDFNVFVGCGNLVARKSVRKRDAGMGTSSWKSKIGREFA